MSITKLQNFLKFIQQLCIFVSSSWCQQNFLLVILMLRSTFLFALFFLSFSFFIVIKTNRTFEDICCFSALQTPRCSMNFIVEFFLGQFKLFEIKLFRKHTRKQNQMLNFPFDCYLRNFIADVQWTLIKSYSFFFNWTLILNADQFVACTVRAI